MLARQIMVGFGIAAILPWLILYGLSTVYPQPKYEHYYAVPLAPDATAAERKVQADEMRKRQEDFNARSRSFARVLFPISTVLGVAAILIGAHVASNAIGAGLILGGIFSLALCYWGHSQYLDDWLRFLSLLTGFAALIYVGLKKLPRG